MGAACARLTQLGALQARPCSLLQARDQLLCLSSSWDIWELWPYPVTRTVLTHLPAPHWAARTAPARTGPQKPPRRRWCDTCTRSGRAASPRSLHLLEPRPWGFLTITPRAPRLQNQHPPPRATGRTWPHTWHTACMKSYCFSRSNSRAELYTLNVGNFKLHLTSWRNTLIST